MIAANELNTNAALAFAGCQWLRPGVLDTHRYGRYERMSPLAGIPAALLRSR